MPEYRRPRIAGSTIFFTVNLARRGDDLLIREMDRLRQAVADTLVSAPCHIDAMVILPDHIHTVWTLPADDYDYSGRWGKIKSVSSAICRMASVDAVIVFVERGASGNAGSGSITYAGLPTIGGASNIA